MAKKKGKGGKVFHATKSFAAREAEKHARPTQKRPLMERYTDDQLRWRRRHDREEVFLYQRARNFNDTLDATRACREGKNPDRARCVIGRDRKLVEKILSYTDFHTVLVAGHRVNKLWYLIIFESDMLRQMMFIKPLATPGLQPFEAARGWSPEEIPEAMRHVTRGGDVSKGGRVFNPLLVEKFGPVFFDFGEHSNRFRRCEYFYRMPWVNNTYDVVHIGDKHGLQDVLQLKAPEHGLESQSLKLRLKAAAEARADDREHRRRFTRRGASWRRMLVTQPPPPHLISLFYDPIPPKELARDKEGNQRWEIKECIGVGLPEDIPWDENRSSEWNARRRARMEQKAQATPAILQRRIDEARMGHFYDCVAVLGGNSYKNGRFFRILWAQPTAPLTRENVAEARTKVLAEYGFVLELHDQDYALTYPQVGPDGMRAQTFVDTFWTQDTHWTETKTRVRAEEQIVTGPKPAMTPYATLFSIQATHFPFDGCALVDNDAISPMLEAIEKPRRRAAAAAARRAAREQAESESSRTSRATPTAEVEIQDAQDA